MPRFPPAIAAALWLEWNATIEKVATDHRVTYHRLRYEDFAKDPHGSLARFGLAPRDFGAESTLAAARGWHTVAGNPSRLRSGPFRVRADEEWRRKMGRHDAITVSLIASPLLKRYGYTFRLPE